MSTPELEQAIAAAKWKGTEANFTEAISKMFDVPPEVVARVVFAWETLRNQCRVHAIEGQMDVLCGGLEDGDDLPEEIVRAIKHATARALPRMAIRWRMERGLFLEVPFNKLVPADKPDRICDGCPNQLECVRDMLSTPARCLRGERITPRDQADPRRLRYIQHQNAQVKAVKIHGDIVTVEAEHPRGIFHVGVLDVLV